MSSILIRVLSTALAALAAPGLTIAAGRSDLQAACFPSVALAASTGEAKPVRGAPGSQIALPKIALSPATPVAPALRGAIRRVELPKGRKLVALTFDLCEQPGEVAGYDGAIIDYLRASGVKATLFAGGKWLLSHPERAQQVMSDPLFEIGIHGWAHRNVRALSGQALLDEMLGPLKAYRRMREDLSSRACAAPHAASLASVPERPTLTRFPYGACNAQALDTAAANGLLAIQWDVATGDPAPSQSARAIVEEMVRHTKPGSIVINHANGRGYHTAEALPQAIPKLKAMGYEFVTVSELIAAGRPVTVNSCYDAHPGDTDKYDFLFSKRPAATGLTGAKGNGWSANSVPR